MIAERAALDSESALSYLGKTVLLELVWNEEAQSVWRCLRIVGVVLPMDGLRGGPHFLTLGLKASEEFAEEAFWEDIRTIRVMRHRDRHGSGNVLDRLALPTLERSGAARPARRNSATVPANGRTGGANP